MGFRTLGLAGLALWLVGCQGGVLQITPFEEGVRPAGVVIEDLRAAPDEPSSEKILVELQSRRGDHLDWEQFWKLLSAETELAKKLLTQNRASLLALQTRGCDSRGHSSFARFLISLNDGWEALLPPRRTCQAPLGPEISVAIARRIFSQKLSPEDEAAWVGFLTKEMRDTPDSSAWSGALETEDRRRLAGAVGTLLEEQRLAEALPFLSQYARLGQGLLGEEKIRERIFLDPSLLGYFRSRFGMVETITLLSLLWDSDQGGRRPHYSPVVLKATMTLLLREPFEEIGTDIHTGWQHYLRWRHLVDSLSQRWKFPERLKLLQRQQEEAEAWLVSLPASDRELFLRERRNGEPCLAEAGDSAWLRLRIDSQFPESERASVLAHLNSLSSRLISEVDRALNLRVRIHLQERMSERKALAEEYCRLFEEQGSRREKVSKSDMGVRLKGKLNPGCYLVEAELPPAFSETGPLRMSFDSIVQMPFASVMIQAPDVELGILDLSDLGEKKDEAVENRGLQGGKLTVVSPEAPRPFGFVSHGGLPPDTSERGIDGQYAWKKN